MVAECGQASELIWRRWIVCLLVYVVTYFAPGLRTIGGEARAKDRKSVKY